MGRLVSIEFLCRYKTVKMNEKNENSMKNGNREENKDLCEEAINGIACREDLHPFFERSDRSINKVHFSAVNTFITQYFRMNKIREC